MKRSREIHFFGAGAITFVDQKRQIIGASISFFLHAICLCCIISASSALTNLKPAMVIDFSIEKKLGDTTVKKSDKTEQRKLSSETQISKVLANEKPLLPPPPKEEVLTPQIIPAETKKEVMEEKLPEQIMVEQPPAVTTEDDIVAEHIESETELAARGNIQETQAVVAYNDTNEDLGKAAIPTDVRSPVVRKERYVKEHFLYIKESVQNQITYPPIARRMGWQGKVLVSFVICRDGSVKDIKIIESSGFKALDNNAVEVIQKTAPFPQPPVSAELIIPIVYKLS